MPMPGMPIAKGKIAMMFSNGDGDAGNKDANAKDAELPSKDCYDRLRWEGLGTNGEDGDTRTKDGRPMVEQRRL